MGSSPTMSAVRCRAHACRSSVSTAPFPFGWLFLDLNTTVTAAGNNPPVDPQAAQAWVVTTQASNGHFGIGIDAIRLDSACAANHFFPQSGQGGDGPARHAGEVVEESGPLAHGRLSFCCINRLSPVFRPSYIAFP